MSNLVSWNLQLNVRDGQLNASQSLMKEMIEATQKESGTRMYQWFYSNDGKTCHITEGYTDSSAVMVHLGTFGSTFVERFMACFEPTSFFVYGNPSAEARAVLDGFGAAYLDSVDGFTR